MGRERISPGSVADSNTTDSPPYPTVAFTLPVSDPLSRNALHTIARLGMSENNPLCFMELTCQVLTGDLGFSSASIVLADRKVETPLDFAESFIPGVFGILENLAAQPGLTACLEKASERDEPVVINNPVRECPQCPMRENRACENRRCRRFNIDDKRLGIISISGSGRIEQEAEGKALLDQLSWTLDSVLGRMYRERELQDRARRMECLNSVSVLISNRDSSIPEILKDTALKMLDGCRDPEISLPEIRYGGEVYRGRPGSSANVVSRQSANILVEDGIAGTVSVGYIESAPETKLAALQKEDLSFLDSIAAILGNAIESRLGRESLELYRNITSTLSHPISYIDRDYRYQAVNKVFTDFFDIDYNSIIGHKVSELFDPDVYKNLVKPNIDRCLSGKDLHYLVAVDSCDKGKRWMEMRYRPYHRADGEIAGIITHGTDITEFKQAEERVKRFKTISDKGVHGKIIMNLDGSITYANEYIARIHGYTPEELTGQHISCFHNDDQLKTVARILDSLEENDQAGPVEVWHSHKNGTRFPMLASFSLFRDEHQHPQFVACSAIDISMQKQAEEKLLKSELRLRNVFNHTYQLTGIVDLDGKLAAANQTSLDFIGKTESEVIDLPFWDTPWWSHSPEHKEWLRDAISRAGKGESIRREVTHLNIKNEVHYFDFSLKPFINENGKILYLIAESRDITEQRIAVKALQESEIRFRTIIENAPIFIDAFNEEGRCLIWNRHSQKTFGWSIEEINEHEDVFSLFYKDPEEHAAVIQSVKEADGLFSEWHPVTRDGKELITMWANFRLPEGMGISLGYDLTEIKKADREKTRLEEQFRRVQKMESIGRLAGGVAHDLNNLLTPILGYSEILLEDERLDECAKERIEKISEAGDKARDLVKQLLAFGRKQNLDFQSVDVNSLLHGFENLLRRTIREDIHIKLFTASALPCIHGDPGQIERIVMNLAVNAQDAMPRGGELIIRTTLAVLDDAYAATHQDVKPGEYVMLEVSDTGCGMDEETIEKVFEPFFTTKDKEKGTGLGLSTVYGIVKQHGGNIWAYSETDIGSSFKVYLPVPPEAPASHAKPNAEKPSNLPGASETILVVEDNEDVRNLASSVLAQNGYQVISTESGPKALDALKQHPGPIQLLLTDVIMPGMNGRELHEKIMKERPEIKTIFMSGYTEDVIACHGIQDTSISFLQKPFSIGTLTSKIRNTLDSE